MGSTRSARTLQDIEGERFCVLPEKVDQEGFEAIHGGHIALNPNSNSNHNNNKEYSSIHNSNKNKYCRLPNLRRFSC